jgi:hypothetical protein
MAEDVKCSLTEFKQYFEEGSRKIAAAEIMALKKDKDTGELRPDYDQIAVGIGNGTFTY